MTDTACAIAVRAGAGVAPTCSESNVDACSPNALVASEFVCRLGTNSTIECGSQSKRGAFCVHAAGRF